MTNATWTVVDDALPLLTCEYSFGPGLATALAVGLPDGLAVVSPPCRADAAVQDALAARGRVAALVASNAFHHMGLPAWRRRFPDAGVYAPAQSIARVQKKTGIAGIRPLADLAPLAGTRVDFIDMPHYRTGEVLVRVRTARGVAWYVTDAVLNFARPPENLVARLVFGLTNSAPGLRFNNVGASFMVKDKRALKRWLAAEYDREPPAFMIPAHGAVAECGDGRLRRLFEG